MAGIQPEQEQESHVLPPLGPLHPDASSNSEPTPPSTPLSTIVPALTRDKTSPATSCNLLSWFRHPLVTFTASLKRRRCASSGDNDPKAGRKKKAQTLGDACAEDEAAVEAKARQEKKAPGSDPELLAESISKAIGATTTAHIVDCLNDDDVYMKKEDMAIAGKEEKAKAKEQQESPENVVEKKWDGQLIDDITGGNNHKVPIMSPNNKQPESAPITIEEAAAAHPVATAGGCWEMNQQLAAGIQDAAENAEEAAAPATQDTAVTAVSGIREIK